LDSQLEPLSILSSTQRQQDRSETVVRDLMLNTYWRQSSNTRNWTLKLRLLLKMV